VRSVPHELQGTSDYHGSSSAVSSPTAVASLGIAQPCMQALHTAEPAVGSQVVRAHLLPLIGSQCSITPARCCRGAAGGADAEPRPASAGGGEPCGVWRRWPPLFCISRLRSDAPRRTPAQAPGRGHPPRVIPVLRLLHPCSSMPVRPSHETATWPSAGRETHGSLPRVCRPPLSCQPLPEPDVSVRHCVAAGATMQQRAHGATRQQRAHGQRLHRRRGATPRSGSRNLRRKRHG
jgi:hypothetical protein